MKDPAFLFYSKDFYEGTRMMLPEERACYIDLMIYQHQNGFIPDDARRMKMYCSGVDEATLQAVLEAKFKLSDKGWYNERLQNEMQSREEFAKNRSTMGSIGQFWKKAKAYFSSQKEYQKYRKRFSAVDSERLYALINSQEIKELSNPQAMLEAMLKHIEIEDGNEIENENINEDKKKRVQGEKDFEDFRKAYPGTKLGHAKEFATLKKHDDWPDIVPLLMPSLERQAAWREQALSRGTFCPPWPNLSTWLNQRRWEQEEARIESQTLKSVRFYTYGQMCDMVAAGQYRSEDFKFIAKDQWQLNR